MNLQLFSDEICLIKFGVSEQLNNIKRGKIWFRTLEYYREYYRKNECKRISNSIGDKYEGVESIINPEDCDSITFSHPLVNNGKLMDIKSSINGQVHSFPNYPFYISCFSFITSQNIKDNNIFNDNFFNEEDWHNVICFPKSDELINSLKQSINPNNVIASKVTYLDFSKSYTNLNIFQKDIVFKWQREFRLAIEIKSFKHNHIHVIDDNTIEVDFNPVNCMILTTEEFRRNVLK